MEPQRDIHKLFQSRIPWYHWSRYFGWIYHWYRVRADTKKLRNTWRMFARSHYIWVPKGETDDAAVSGIWMHFLVNGLGERKIEYRPWGKAVLMPDVYSPDLHSILVKHREGWLTGFYSEDDVIDLFPEKTKGKK
jgi:hypothetical protein